MSIHWVDALIVLAAIPFAFLVWKTLGWVGNCVSTAIAWVTGV